MNAELVRKGLCWSDFLKGGLRQKQKKGLCLNSHITKCVLSLRDTYIMTGVPNFIILPWIKCHRLDLEVCDKTTENKLSSICEKALSVWKRLWVKDPTGLGFKVHLLQVKNLLNLHRELHGCPGQPPRPKHSGSLQKFKKLLKWEWYGFARETLDWKLRRGSAATWHFNAGWNTGEKGPIKE